MARHPASQLGVVVLALILAACSGVAVQPTFTLAPTAAITATVSRVPTLAAAQATSSVTRTPPRATVTRPPGSTPCPVDLSRTVPVSITVAPSTIKAGDVLTVSFSADYGMCTDVELKVNATPVAVLDPGCTSGPACKLAGPTPYLCGCSVIKSDSPEFRLLPATQANSLGCGSFVVQVTRVGRFDVLVYTFGDAGFCNEVEGRCICSTTFKSGLSEPVSVTVLQ